MCGVAGAYQQPDGKVVVGTMVDRIDHRGPDACGVVELVDPDTSVVLGHRRLSIIDLSTAADQPFAKDGLTLNLVTIIATFGTPQDVTLQDLRIESFLPADEATEQLLRSLAG